MIKSMTGFGRYEVSEGIQKIIVEIKSVNHRYLDINIKMPKKFNSFESSVRNSIKQYIQRGKADVYISYEDLEKGGLSIRYNEYVAKQYLDSIRDMAKNLSIECDLTATKLSRYPDIFTLEEQDLDEEEISKQIESALIGAAKQFVITREKEGENLKKDMLEKLNNMSNSIAEIEKRSPEVLLTYEKKIQEKVQALLENAGMDQSRIIAEVAIFADKTCIDEEIVRLKNHIETTIHTLNEGGCVGRKLDFIIQEMNREANTILSKSNDLSVSEQGIMLKTEIEKIREQIQNIE